MRATHRLRLAFCFACLLSTARPAIAKDAREFEPPAGMSVNERVLMVTGDPARLIANPKTWEMRPAQLQVTLMMPDGPGPFPLAVLNHGSEQADEGQKPRDVPRRRFGMDVFYFLSRGYAVAQPMLRGYAGSEGVNDSRACIPEEHGLGNARDIRAVIEYLGKQSYIDAQRIVVGGQSLGGWNTLALGTLNVPGVRGLVNFAGGLRFRPGGECTSTDDDMIAGAASFGRSSKLPSIWLYGDNDRRIPVALWQKTYDGYVAGGSKAELVRVGRFEEDSHQLIARPQGMSLWTPRMDAFLERIGLPSRKLHPEYLPMDTPPPSGFARLDDVTALDRVSGELQDSYRKFLALPRPRAYVIAPGVAGIASNGGLDPLADALKLCAEHSRHCQPYAVNDQVVWQRPSYLPKPTNYARLDDVDAVPRLSEGLQDGYRQFLKCPLPRAFAIAPTGAAAIMSGGDDIAARTLEACDKDFGNCRLYAVDNDVVWIDPRTTPPAAAAAQLP